MKKINTDFKYLFALWILLILAIIPTLFHYGHILIDCGREVYYPTQILQGKVLYRDLFNIYGPFSYMFNAFLFKIFSIHLNVLYAIGCISAFLIVNLTYLLSRRFLTPFLSFTITVFAISAGVLHPNLFNFIFPYSFAMLYGLVAFLGSVFFLLKYQEKPEKLCFLYASCLLAGLCVVSKYEFVPYLLVIFYSMIKIKPLKFTQYYYSILALCAVPIFCFGTLFLQGLNINDLLAIFHILGEMAHSQTLNYFYKSQGIYYTNEVPPLLLKTFLLTSFAFFCLLRGVKSNSKIISFALVALSVLLTVIVPVSTVLAFLPLLVLILAIFSHKELRENLALQILTFSAVLFSAKTFLTLLLIGYGTYFAGILLITTLALLSEKLKEKGFNQASAGAYVLLLSVLLAQYNLNVLKFKTELTSTDRGKIYNFKTIAPATEELIGYINKNTQKSDRVVIFPEGLFINFLTERKSDGYYNSLIPLYVEVFGEDKLIEHFKTTKPEYIVFNNWDNKDYYLRYICQDYAVEFCNFVATEYSSEKVIDKGFRYLIFKRK